jgi:hypothetical protein
MQNKANGFVSNAMGWITTVGMSIAAIALLVSLF